MHFQKSNYAYLSLTYECLHTQQWTLQRMAAKFIFLHEEGTCSLKCFYYLYNVRSHSLSVEVL